MPEFKITIKHKDGRKPSIMQVHLENEKELGEWLKVFKPFLDEGSEISFVENKEIDISMPV